jgi:hypothetical protein
MAIGAAYFGIILERLGASYELLGRFGNEGIWILTAIGSSGLQFIALAFRNSAAMTRSIRPSDAKNHTQKGTDMWDLSHIPGIDPVRNLSISTLGSDTQAFHLDRETKKGQLVAQGRSQSC